MGEVEFGRGNWIGSDDRYRRALELDPNDPDALLRYMIRLGQAGRFKDALSFAERLWTLEPFVPVYNIFGGWVLALNGQSTAGIAMLEQVPAEAAGGYFRNATLASLYAHEGRFSEAADQLLAIPARQSIVSRRMVEDAARVLRTAPRRAAAPESLPALESLSWVYGYVGAENRRFDFIERSVAARWFGTFVPPWLPKELELRKTARFKALMRNAGLVDYWRARGWPDLCRPVGADDFVCD
jgi:tetratricopeptide (TPR) repeat protein